MAIKTSKTSEQSSDELLMAQIALGNRAAFELLYARYFSKLLWFAQGFVGDKAKAEDIVQEVFMKIIHRPESFDIQQKFVAWVYSLTANACKNMLRNEQNRAQIIAAIETPLSTYNQQQVDESLMRQQIQSLLIKLSSKEKELYQLRIEESLSIKEIAAIMQIPEGSVKSGMYYLLKKLAHQLKAFTHG